MWWAGRQGAGRSKYGGGRRVRVLGVVSMVVGGASGAGRGKYGGRRGVRVLGVVSMVVGGVSWCWAA